MTDTIDFDELIEEHDEDTPLIKQLRQQLRDKARSDKAKDEKLAEYERKDTVRAAGLNHLTERQMKALLAAHDGEFTSDALKTTAVELGFAEPDPDDQAREEEMAAQQRMAQATAGAGAAASAGKITPVDAAGWSAEKWMRFAKQHPEHAEAIRRGQEVVGVSF